MLKKYGHCQDTVYQIARCRKRTRWRTTPFQILLGRCHSTWEKSTRVELVVFNIFQSYSRFHPSYGEITRVRGNRVWPTELKKTYACFCGFFHWVLFTKYLQVLVRTLCLHSKKKVLLNVKFAFWEFEWHTANETAKPRNRTRKDNFRPNFLIISCFTASGWPYPGEISEKKCYHRDREILQLSGLSWKKTSPRDLSGYGTGFFLPAIPPTRLFSISLLARRWHGWSKRR